MKAKKAIKRLDHVEALLSGVIDEFGADGPVGQLLESAKETVFRAKAKMTEGQKPKPAKKKAAPVKRKSAGAATAARKPASKTA